MLVPQPTIYGDMESQSLYIKIIIINYVTVHACRVAVVLSTMGGLMCVSVEAGGLCVMTFGKTRMQVWRADSWASQNLVYK